KPNVHTHGVRANMWRYADYDGDGRQDLVVGVGDWKAYGWDNAYDPTGVWTNGPLHGYVYVLGNRGTDAEPRYAEPFKVMAEGGPVDVFGWPSPNFADWDGDGDLDLLCGEFLDGFTYFQNRGTRTQPAYAAGVRVKRADGARLVMDLQMITPTAIDWDRDGDLDLICGDEDGRVAFIENTGDFDGARTPLFREPRYFRQQAQDVKFGALVTPVGCDWDGDGDWDLVCGNSAGYIAFVENLSGRGVAPPRWAAPKRLEAGGQVLRIMAGPNGSIQGPCEAKWGYTTQTVADWDGDGLPDIVANSILGKVQWYRNVGSRSAPALSAAQPIEVEWDGAQPRLMWGWMKPEGRALLTQWRTTPVAVDWNKDGLVDLAMLDPEGYLAFFERSLRDGRKVLLHPRRVFCDGKGAPLQFNAGRGGRSGRRKLCVTDWDGDGRLDILINSKNAEFWRQIGEKDGRFLFKNMGGLHPKSIEGHDVSPTVVDFDDNGIPDFIGGAEDGYLYYLRNPRAPAAR
ncbi:MAG: VCBS repeat-containing protein, partial [Verrucomicrobia bacterium]|nr:VCBS repeat-containing protein [Verrucomicrobiota bacterium]